jgi:hypothetical protein
VEFARCPYDASPIESEAYVDGATLLYCLICGAAWEWHKTWLRRVREPDREALRSAWTTNEPVQSSRTAASAETVWRHVMSSISSICHRSNTTPPIS